MYLCMYMYVCMYVCMHVCMYVCMYAFHQFVFRTASRILNLKSIEECIYSDCLETSILALHISLTGLDLIEQERIFIHFVVQNFNELVYLITKLKQQN